MRVKYYLGARCALGPVSRKGQARGFQTNLAPSESPSSSSSSSAAFRAPRSQICTAPHSPTRQSGGAWRARKGLVMYDVCWVLGVDCPRLDGVELQRERTGCACAVVKLAGTGRVGSGVLLFRGLAAAEKPPSAATYSEPRALEPWPSGIHGTQQRPASRRPALTLDPDCSNARTRLLKSYDFDEETVPRPFLLE